MRWSNVKLIWQREMRDQLRDRRTLFMVVVLPVLLYPLMGMAAFQITQFMREYPTRIGLVGAQQLPAAVPLLGDDGQIRPDWFSTPDRANLLECELIQETLATNEMQSWAQSRLQRGDLDAIVYFPPRFGESLDRFLHDQATVTTEPPQPQLFFTGKKDRSRIAQERLVSVLGRWRMKVVQKNLAARNIPMAAADPFSIRQNDVTDVAQQRGVLWAKILPFVLVVWALTGAFYPAVDLCAGEKERGTLETLLCSPAERQEIVWGKLLTVTVFSFFTSLLNLASLAGTGAVVTSRLQLPMGNEALTLGTPQLSMIVWLLAALLPLSALFSALALATATLARSTKEGQYYLMPLLFLALPLAMLSIMPSNEISLGNSLIPVTGVMMILRTLLEGDYLVALRFVIPVTLVTGVCCVMAVKWAVHQFNDESVLFRESEQFNPLLWLRHLVRDRGVTPSLAEGVMAGVLLLVLQFFVRLFAPATVSWETLALSTLALQIGFLLLPTLVMTRYLTASTTRTLLLRPTTASSLIAAVLLAVFMQPTATAFRELIQWTYPINPQLLEQLGQVSQAIGNAPTWQTLLVLAILPALCEEIAYRGFVLSGLRHLGSKGMAIFVTSVFFGVVHGILQQSINACLLGMVLGYIAVQTGSILPCMIFHSLHNSLQLLSGSWMSAEALEQHPPLQHFLGPSLLDEQMIVYRTPVLVASILASGLLLRWFRSLPFSPTPEERLQEALEHQATVAVR